jgi:hypothetical protein
MPEMSDSCEHHCQPQAVSGFNDLFIADGAAGLDNGGNAHLGGGFYAVGKGEEGIGGQNCAFGFFVGFCGSQFGGVYTAG